MAERVETVPFGLGTLLAMFAVAEDVRGQLGLGERSLRMAHHSNVVERSATSIRSERVSVVEAPPRRRAVRGAQTAGDARVGTRRGSARPTSARNTQAPDDAPGGSTQVRLAAPWQSVWLASIISLITFCVLTSGSLVSTARAMPIGPSRSVALPIASGIDRFANFLSLNRPADAIDSVLGRTQHNADYQPPVPRAAPQSDAGERIVAPPLRVVTEALPLVVSAVGDSMAQPIGEFLASAQADGAPYRVSYEYKISSGLARPDFFNWPARLLEISATQKPEALVVLFGGNDGQELTDPFGQVVARPGTTAWETTYRERVGGLMDVLKADGHRLVWVLPPRMREPRLDSAALIMARVISEQAKSRPWVVTVDSAKVTSGPDGEFSEFVTNVDGSPIECRQDDGVHFTVACTKRVGREIINAIDSEWEITPATADGDHEPSSVPLSQIATTVPTTMPGP